jgi:hypothetical protein
MKTIHFQDHGQDFLEWNIESVDLVRQQSPQPEPEGWRSGPHHSAGSRGADGCPLPDREDRHEAPEGGGRLNSDTDTQLREIEARRRNGSAGIVAAPVVQPPSVEEIREELLATLDLRTQRLNDADRLDLLDGLILALGERVEEIAPEEGAEG